MKPVSFGPAISDIIKQVAPLHKSLWIQMTHLGIIKLTSIDRWPDYAVTWLDRFHCNEFCVFCTVAVEGINILIIKCVIWVDFPKIRSHFMIVPILFVNVFNKHIHSVCNPAEEQLQVLIFSLTVIVHTWLTFFMSCSCVTIREKHQ